MNTHNVCLYGETRKNISTFRLKKKNKKKNVFIWNCEYFSYFLKNTFVVATY